MHASIGQLLDALLGLPQAVHPLQGPMLTNNTEVTQARLNGNCKKYPSTGERVNQPHLIPGTCHTVADEAEPFLRNATWPLLTWTL
jgi:hypothetical protein